MGSPVHLMPRDFYQQFGPFRLKVGVGLWRDDREVPLPPKEMALLELLVLNQGKVVEHETIYRHLWPRQSVGYQSLVRCVYSLRNALQPEGREYIRTIPKRGYRLTVPADSPWMCSHRSALESSIQTKPQAYSHFQAGLAAANNPDPDSMERALHWFRESLRLDPDYAAAHAAIAEVSMIQCFRGFIQPQEGLRVGLDACHAALSIDPNIVQALSLRGLFEALQQGEMETGKKTLAYAQRLDPGYSRSYAYEALVHRAEGNLQAALASADRAVGLDPHSRYNSAVHDITLFLAGKVNEALDFERQILEQPPEGRSCPRVYQHFPRHARRLSAGAGICTQNVGPGAGYTRYLGLCGLASGGLRQDGRSRRPAREGLQRSAATMSASDHGARTCGPGQN